MELPIRQFVFTISVTELFPFMSDSYNANRLHEDSRIARPEGFKPFIGPLGFAGRAFVVYAVPAFTAVVLGRSFGAIDFDAAALFPWPLATQPAREHPKTLISDTTCRCYSSHAGSA